MKRNLFIKILTAIAIICVALRLLQTSFSAFFSSALAFPFEQIGLGLRVLSLSGTPGNAAALAIYAAVSLSPACLLLVLRKKRELYREDVLLGLLSPVLFAVLYFMINPAMIGMVAGESSTGAGQAVGKAFLGSMVYSVLCGYLILRVLRLFSAADTNRLMRYMSVMLMLLSLLFVYMAFGACFDSCLDSIASLKAGNTGNEHVLGLTYVFLGLRFVVDALPYLLNVLIVFAALPLLDEMQKDRYSAETVTATKHMSRLCAVALTTIVLSIIGFNLLQLLFVKSLMVINSFIQIPVFSIAFVLAVLLLTQFVTENKELKDDNDMFI